MAGIQATTGLVTGIPIADTVAQLMQIEARPRDLLVSRTETINSEAAAIAELTASVLSLQFTAKKFQDNKLFTTAKATSSNTSLISAAVTGSPRTGAYQFTPIRTAQSQQYLSSGVASLSDTLAEGKIKLSHGPRLDEGIALDQLNNGQGVQRGEIRITDRGGASSTIDLSYAQTIDDVLDAINESESIQVTASVDGDQIRLTDNTGLTTSNLIVQAVGTSSTASDLGLAGINAASDTALGSDILGISSTTALSVLNDGNGISLDSALADLGVTLRDGTSLEIELGTAAAPEDFATATTVSTDASLTFSSVQQGADYDGVQIVFEDNGSIIKGNETVVFDANAKTLTFQIDAGNTTASDIVSVLAGDATASQYFSASAAGGSTSGIIDPARDTATTLGTTGAATATTTAANPDASITLTANATGGTYDGVTILFVDDPGVTAGSETVVYDDSDPDNKTLTVNIDAGLSTGQNVVDAINNDPTVSALFTAANAAGSAGTGLVDTSDTATTTGGIGTSSATTATDTDNSSVTLTAKVKGANADGYRLEYVVDGAVTKGNETVTVDTSDPNDKVIRVGIAEGATTAIDVVTALNNNADVAELFTASKVATASGTRIVDASLTATTENGAAQEASQPKTVGDLIDLINAVAPTKLRAQISTDGDRIELVDLTSGGGTFAASSINGSGVAEDLGLTSAAIGGTISGRRLQGGLKSTLVSTLGGGNGLGTLGTISITDRSGASAVVDLSSAESVEDILAEINAANLEVSAAVNDAGNGIVLSDTSGQFASNFIVADNDGTNTASLLKIAANSTELTVDSGSLDRQFISEQTTLSSLNGGKGIERGKFLIRNSAGQARTFDLNSDTSIETIGDLLDTINAQLALEVEARINASGDGIELIDKSTGSGTFAVTEGSSSTTTAAQLGLLGAAEEKDINGTPRQVITGSQVTTVDIEAGDTLQTLIDKINSLDIGISASSLNTGSGTNPIRLSLVSTISGRQGAISIDSTQSSFAFEEIVAAQDALLLFGSASNAAAGILTTSSTNSFPGVLEGVSLTVKESSETSVTVNVDITDDPLTSAAEDFVKQYNSLRDKLSEHTFFNEADNSTGILFGSNEALRVDTELANLVTSRFAGLGKFQSLEQLGFEFLDTGKLSLNKAKLEQAFAEDAEGVEEFFTKATTGFADKIFALTEQFAGEGSSLLVSRAQTLQRRADLNTERIEFFNERLERKSEQLLKQFYNLEITIGRLQNNLTALSQVQYIGPDTSSQ